MTNLSRRQKAVLNYIIDSTADHGYPPSVREICEAVGLKSPSTVHSHIKTLEKEGYLKRGKGKTRALTPTEKALPHEGVPILGTVAAGQPILAVEDAIGYIDYYAGESDEYFALKIRGDSMINAGILDGDFVIVHKQQVAKNGEIVIALIEDDATCKRLSLSGNEIWLLPENDEYPEIDGSSAVILGKVTAVIRQY